MVARQKLTMATNCKIAICFLAYVVFSGLCSVSGAQWNSGYQPPQAGHTVTIESVGGMTPKMEDDAATLLKAALATDKPWVTLRDTFTVKHPEFLWHVFVYKEYAMTPHKFIEMKVDNKDLYLLMATQKTA